MVAGRCRRGVVPCRQQPLVLTLDMSSPCCAVEVCKAAGVAFVRASAKGSDPSSTPGDDTHALDIDTASRRHHLTVRRRRCGGGL